MEGPNELEPLGKRKRSDEGLGLGGLLGAYASEEDEEELQGLDGLDKAQSITLIGATVLDNSLAGTVEGVVEGIHEALEAAVQRAELTPQLASPADSKTGDVDEGADEEVSEGVQGQPPADEQAVDLPPELAEPPSEPCAPELQQKITDFLHKQQSQGITISEMLRRHRGYRNPDFLELCVKHHKLTECTSCYPQEVFDPTNLPPEDFYDRLAAEWQAMQDKRTAERQATGHIQFTKGHSEAAARPAYAPAAQGGVASIAAKLVGQVKAASAGGSRSSKWDTKR